MRIATASVILLTITAQASASEAFVTQVTNKTVATEQAVMASAKTMASAAMLALPVKLNANALNLPNPPAATPGTNTSLVMQSGTNNIAAVTQVGGGNASSIVQRGSGNQAIVTQRH